MSGRRRPRRSIGSPSAAGKENVMNKSSMSNKSDLVNNSRTSRSDSNKLYKAALDNSRSQQPKLKDISLASNSANNSVPGSVESTARKVCRAMAYDAFFGENITPRGLIEGFVEATPDEVLTRSQIYDSQKSAREKVNQDGSIITRSALSASALISDASDGSSSALSVDVSGNNTSGEMAQPRQRAGRSHKKARNKSRVEGFEMDPDQDITATRSINMSTKQNAADTGIEFSMDTTMLPPRRLPRKRLKVSETDFRTFLADDAGGEPSAAFSMMLNADETPPANFRKRMRETNRFKMSDINFSIAGKTFDRSEAISGTTLATSNLSEDESTRFQTRAEMRKKLKRRTSVHAEDFDIDFEAHATTTANVSQQPSVREPEKSAGPTASPQDLPSADDDLMSHDVTATPPIPSRKRTSRFGRQPVAINADDFYDLSVEKNSALADGEDPDASRVSQKQVGRRENASAIITDRASMNSSKMDTSKRRSVKGAPAEIVGNADDYAAFLGDSTIVTDPGVVEGEEEPQQASVSAMNKSVRESRSNVSTRHEVNKSTSKESRQPDESSLLRTRKGTQSPHVSLANQRSPQKLASASESALATPTGSPAAADQSRKQRKSRSRAQLDGNEFASLLEDEPLEGVEALGKQANVSQHRQNSVRINQDTVAEVSVMRESIVRASPGKEAAMVSRDAHLGDAEATPPLSGGRQIRRRLAGARMQVDENDFASLLAPESVNLSTTVGPQQLGTSTEKEVDAPTPTFLRDESSIDEKGTRHSVRKSQTAKPLVLLSANTQFSPIVNTPSPSARKAGLSPVPQAIEKSSRSLNKSNKALSSGNESDGQNDILSEKENLVASFRAGRSSIGRERGSAPAEPLLENQPDSDLDQGSTPVKAKVDEQSEAESEAQATQSRRTRSSANRSLEYVARAPELSNIVELSGERSSRRSGSRVAAEAASMDKSQAGKSRDQKSSATIKESVANSPQLAEDMRPDDLLEEIQDPIRKRKSRQSIYISGLKTVPTELDMTRNFLPEVESTRLVNSTRLEGLFPVDPPSAYRSTAAGRAVLTPSATPVTTRLSQGGRVNTSTPLIEAEGARATPNSSKTKGGSRDAGLDPITNTPQGSRNAMSQTQLASTRVSLRQQFNKTAPAAHQSPRDKTDSGRKAANRSNGNLPSRSMVEDEVGQSIEVFRNASAAGVRNERLSVAPSLLYRTRMRLEEIVEGETQTTPSVVNPPMLNKLRTNKSMLTSTAVQVTPGLEMLHKTLPVRPLVAREVSTAEDEHDEPPAEVVDDQAEDLQRRESVELSGQLGQLVNKTASLMSSLQNNPQASGLLGGEVGQAGSLVGQPDSSTNSYRQLTTSQLEAIRANHDELGEVIDQLAGQLNADVSQDDDDDEALSNDQNSVTEELKERYNMALKQKERLAIILATGKIGTSGLETPITDQSLSVTQTNQQLTNRSDRQSDLHQSRRPDNDEQHHDNDDDDQGSDVFHGDDNDNVRDHGDGHNNVENVSNNDDIRDEDVDAHNDDDNQDNGDLQSDGSDSEIIINRSVRATPSINKSQRLSASFRSPSAAPRELSNSNQGKSPSPEVDEELDDEVPADVEHQEQYIADVYPEEPADSRQHSESIHEEVVERNRRHSKSSPRAPKESDSTLILPVIGKDGQRELPSNRALKKLRQEKLDRYLSLPFTAKDLAGLTFLNSPAPAQKQAADPAPAPARREPQRPSKKKDDIYCRKDAFKQFKRLSIYKVDNKCEKMVCDQVKEFTRQLLDRCTTLSKRRGDDSIKPCDLRRAAGEAGLVPPVEQDRHNLLFFGKLIDHAPAEVYRRIIPREVRPGVWKPPKDTWDEKIKTQPSRKSSSHKKARKIRSATSIKRIQVSKELTLNNSRSVLSSPDQGQSPDIRKRPISGSKGHPTSAEKRAKKPRASSSAESRKSQSEEERRRDSSSDDELETSGPVNAPSANNRRQEPSAKPPAPAKKKAGPPSKAPARGKRQQPAPSNGDKGRKKSRSSEDEHATQRPTEQDIIDKINGVRKKGPHAKASAAGRGGRKAKK